MILTTFRHDEYVWGALRAGASGFLLKRASPSDCSTPSARLRPARRWSIRASPGT